MDGVAQLPVSLKYINDLSLQQENILFLHEFFV